MQRKRLLLIVAAVVALPAVGLSLWSAATLGYVYSSGERAGYLQKLSHKGWICKTWEGELALQNFPGSTPQIFNFSVRSDAVAAQLQALEGEKVTLMYDQHKGVPSSCFGETEYFVTGSKKVVP
jgi:hypothetical protein